MRTDDLLANRIKWSMRLMMPVSWTSVMAWFADGVPVTVARPGGRLRVSLYSK